MTLANFFRQNQAFVSPEVTLPDAFIHTHLIDVSYNKFIYKNIDKSIFNAIETTDQDVTLRKLIKKEPKSSILFVTGLGAEDFFNQINLSFDATNVSFKAKNHIGPLSKALAKKETVILVGEFSSSLAQALSELIVKKRFNIALTLVTEKIGSLSCFSSMTLFHKVSKKEKLQFIPQKDRPLLSDKLQEIESLSRLEAIVKYLRICPEKTVDNAWQGLDSLGIEKSQQVKSNFKAFAADAKLFHQNRLHQVLNVLESNPYVHLTGVTGVGKTTFVNMTFSENKSYCFFSGIDAVDLWAKADSEKNPILFIDEANLANMDWSIFEGLYYNPPGLIQKGRFFEVSHHHKIIFSANPLSYGDERKKCHFFERHGGIVVFEQFPVAVIFENILKPIFEGFLYKTDEIEETCKPLLEAYNLVGLLDSDEVLLSARELQMIALLNVSQSERPLKEYLFSICDPILGDKSHVLSKLRESHNQKTSSITFKKFCVTPSREPAISLIQSFVKLKEWRLEHYILEQCDFNEHQLYGGLGGIVLEGESGCGKSDLVRSTLISLGYEEQNNFSSDVEIKAKTFLVLPASMPLMQKQMTLETAFNEGVIAVLDEVNSCPMIEASLNSMLMGLHPKTHNRPLKPGFMVIGTQNSTSLAGRRVASSALKRRLVTLKIPEYTQEELIKILDSQTKLDNDDISTLVDVYFERKSYAQNNGLSPAPCFRDLLFVARQENGKNLGC